MIKKASILLLLICSGLLVNAQSQKMRNLPNFDYKMYHFGFILGTNNSDFRINYKPEVSLDDSLLGIINVPQTGFNLNLLASYDPLPNIHVRFFPGLSFQDRGLDYRVISSDGTTDVLTKRTESVFLDFPLALKFRTNRAGNFAAYALVGGKYSIDMQTQKDVANTAEDAIIKLEPRDFSMDIGGGVDFFLPYFKLSIEMKTAFGFPDILIHEESRFADPIESLRTRAFIFSLSFEG